MTIQLLAHARAVIRDSSCTMEQLVEAVGELLSLGDLDAADEAIRLLRLKGASDVAIARLERAARWLRTLAPQFEGTLLAGAIRIVNDPGASDEKLMRAAESLVVWGSLDEADKALTRLRTRDVPQARVNRLAAASRQLRRSGILEELQTLVPQDSLNRPYEVLIRPKPGARRAVIVFTGIANRFWISLNALHCFLRRFDAHVIYLSDFSSKMYVNGVGSLGVGYGSMIAMLKAQMDRLDVQDVRIMATSAGGFVGLRAAIDLQAKCFAGMSIRTTLSPSSGISMSPLEKRVIQECRDPAMLVDLRPILEASEFPRRILLYCGDQSKQDAAHAKNLQEISRVEVYYLESYQRHDVVSGLLARGQFDGVLRELVLDPASPNPVWAGAA